MEKPLVSLIIPCWNEEKTIERFHEEVTKATTDLNAELEFIFVDDGSTDRTYELICSLADQDSRIRALRLSRNFGSFSAITAGFHHCCGDAVICMAADLQDPADLIPRLVERWQAGYDIVWAAIDGRGDTLTKRLASTLFYGLIRKIALKNLPPQGMNMGIFSRRVIDIFRALPERDNIPFFTILKMGFPQDQIPYFRQNREAGSSGWSFWRRVRAALDVIVAFSYAPVRMISAVGFVTAFIGLVYTAFIVFEYLVFGVSVPGWSSLMVVLLMFSGIQLVSLGFIAEYLWRQSQQVRADPRYIVMEEMGKAPRPEKPPSVKDVHNINVSPARRGQTD